MVTTIGLRVTMRWVGLWISVLALATGCHRVGVTHDSGADGGTKPSSKQHIAKKIIRVGYPGVGIGGRPYIAGTVSATLHGKHILEDEFEREGVTVSWSLNKAAGPAINELLSAHQLEFAYLGDLPAIVGRSIGLDTKMILAGGRAGNLYLVVGRHSKVQRLDDLRGKRVVVFKGTALQLQEVRILSQLGYKEADFKTISMDQANGLTALLSGDVDALWAQFPILEYVEKGDARIIVNTQDPLPDGSSLARAFGVLLVATDFEQQHPDWVQKVVNAYVKEADWACNPANQDEMYRLWSRAGHPEVVFRKDDRAIAYKFSPLLDPDFIREVRLGSDAALQFGLIRKAIDVEGWFEPKYLTRALQELHLEKRWQTRDVHGDPTP